MSHVCVRISMTVRVPKEVTVPSETTFTLDNGPPSTADVHWSPPSNILRAGRRSRTIIGIVRFKNRPPVFPRVPAMARLSVLAGEQMWPAAIANRLLFSKWFTETPRSRSCERKFNVLISTCGARDTRLFTGPDSGYYWIRTPLHKILIM